MEISNKEFKLLNKIVIPGETKILELNIATLHTMTELKVPIIVSRSIYDGPVVLLIAGLHGDELSGIEIVRQIISRNIHQPQKGTIICMPLVNVFGFVNQARDFPDGRDLNRVFPGSANGSLASRYAYHIMQEIIPNVDYVIDYHSGGSGRYNAAQIRIEPDQPELQKLAKAFAPPFILYSKNIEGSLRQACDKLGIKYLLFEGGKALDIPVNIIEDGVQGTMRFLDYLQMLNKKHFSSIPAKKCIEITSSTWLRANTSGLFHSHVFRGEYVKEGDILAKISDPYGFQEESIYAPNEGYIICDNETPIVFQGDAIYRISTKTL